MSRLDADRLARYLARIGCDDARTPDAHTLAALHRAHLRSIPYENLDIHLGRSIPIDREAAFAKLVDGRRGGWCFEMNGVLGWALEAIGFDVRYVAGATRRATRGDAALDSHLVLIVTLDRPYIVDVGFGDGIFEPLPLEVGTYRQGFLEYRVSRLGDWWRVHQHPHAGADSYDFTLTPRTLASFEPVSALLQTSPASGFVRSTVSARISQHGDIVVLRGAVLKVIAASGVETRTIADATEYERVLAESFDLTPDGVETLWPLVRARHLAWVAAQAAGCG